MQAAYGAEVIGVFALVIGIMGYFARRLTNDVVRPVEMLQAAAGHLRAGSSRCTRAITS
jgi:hypothetical protein